MKDLLVSDQNMHSLHYKACTNPLTVYMYIMDDILCIQGISFRHVLSNCYCYVLVIIIQFDPHM